MIIPTFNERENISLLAENILRQNSSIEILFVDDNSPDGTGALIDSLIQSEKRISVIHRPCKMGLGSAYREGFRKALSMGGECIIEMDADFSHDPAVIPLFLQKIREFDLVIGSRYINGVSVVNWPIRRLILSYFASVYTRFVTGLTVMDCTSGFKCFRRSALEAIDIDTLESDGYSFQIELKFRCQEKGLKITEIPIIFIDRHAGESKMSGAIVREAVFKVWALKIKSILRRLKGVS